MVRVKYRLKYQLQFTMKPVKYHCTICTSSFVTRSTKLQNLNVVLTIRLEDGIPCYFQPLKQKSIRRALSLIVCFDASKLNRHTNIVYHNVSISVTSSSKQIGVMQPWSHHQPPLTVNTPIQTRFTCLKKPVPTQSLMN
jgi:ribosomal protein L31